MRDFIARSAASAFALLVLIAASSDGASPQQALASHLRIFLDRSEAIGESLSGGRGTVPDKSILHPGAATLLGSAASSNTVSAWIGPGPESPSPQVLDLADVSEWPATAALLLVLVGLGVSHMRSKREARSARAALNATPIGLLIVDLSGKVVDHNRKLQELWAIPNAQIANGRANALLQLALPKLKDPKEFLATVLRLRADPEATTDDTIELADGRLFERHSEPQRIENRVVGRVWGFRDVTSTRTSETVMTEKSRHFRTFLDSVPECIYFKDRESRFTRVNLALAQAHGYANCQEMVGKSDFDSCGAEHAQEAFADEQSLVNELVPIISKEEKETWPGGRESWVLTTKMPLRDENGRVCGTFGISRDITQRKRMEQALAEREHWLSAVLDSIRDSVVALDSLGTIQWINPRAAELTGHECENCCGKLIEEVLCIGEADRVSESPESPLNRLLSGQLKSLERLNAMVMNADGTSVPVELTASAIEFGGNSIAGAVLVIRPIATPVSELR